MINIENGRGYKAYFRPFLHSFCEIKVPVNAKLIRDLTILSSPKGILLFH